MSPEDRAWLAGVLEGLACREVDPRLVDRIISRCSRGAKQASPPPPLPTPASYGDYDGPGAPPLPEEAMVEAALPPPAKSLDEMKAQLAAGPKTKRGKRNLENTTPVAEAPPYTPNNPTVVRLG